MIDKLTCHFFPNCSPHFERLRRWSRIYRYDQIHREKINPKLMVVEYELAAPTPAMAGKSLAWISDLHWHGSSINQIVLNGIETHLQKIKPNYLLLGGDIVADAVDIPELEIVLNRLAKLAPNVFAISGNWEVGKRWLTEKFWRDLYSQKNIHFLSNEVWSDDTVAIYGVPDITNLIFSLPKERFINRTNILMTHSPDTIVAVDNGNDLAEINLALSGHTHGGQIRLPWFGAGYIPSCYHNHFDYGLFVHKKSSTKLIVSSGAGELSCRWRFHCRREIAIIRFSNEN